MPAAPDEEMAAADEDSDLVVRLSETSIGPSRRKLPPALAERYQDIQFVGEGGMATVYRATDPRLGRTVALKLLKVHDEDTWQRFCSEARAQARIAHENVCRVYEAGEADGEPYIAMQYIEGQPLSAIAEHLSLEQGIKLMREVSAAVHEAHRIGLIHRDIKPANIMVEGREDGSYKPYVMDFGLARQVQDRGQTQTGAILGTPAYMAPEQARGNVRAMDRRSDVYSLGATLYEVIAGRPPFVSDHAWNLLMMVALQDAPRLGKVKKGVPGEVETIVMKCLDREPAQRYESARALAEDLQRYLDGEPIVAKRASLGYIAWKKARKNKLLTALIVAAVAASLVLAGVWVREQRLAAERARLAQTLGEDVKEMELFLRAAYELPLHDVENERDIVRRRLERIEARMAASGAAGEGPGHYALGQGHLALGEPEAARLHLEKARLAGYSSAELEYALGRTLGELFRRALEQTKRISNKGEREKKVAELEATLRDPALLHLRAAVGATLEVPAYAEGLIALYEGKNEDAVAKAREAFKQAPWMYEAKRLEGDALFAEGSKYRHDAAFDYERMKEYFEPAGQAYRTAANIGRSDPDVHRAECELWEKMGQAAGSKALPFKAPFDLADAACESAVKSSSKDSGALVQRALMLSARLYAAWNNGDEDAASLAERAQLAAEESARALPGDVMANYAIALALSLKAQVSEQLGRAGSMTPAIAAYERVLAMDPRFAWAVNELGDAHAFEANKAFSAGGDGSALVLSAVQRYQQAMALDPTFVLPVGGRLKVLTAQIEADIERGRDAEADLRALFAAVSELETTGFGPWLTAFWKARAHRLRGSFELAKGGDPRPSVAAAVQAIRVFAGESPEDYWLLVALGRCYLLEAEHARRSGLDPEPALAQARDAVTKARVAGDAKSAVLLLLAARVDIASLRAARQGGAALAASFDAALSNVGVLLTRRGIDASVHQAVAEVHMLRAAWLLKDGKDAKDDLDMGLTMLNKALESNPHLSDALLTKGQIHLLQASASHDKSARAEAARLAKAAFDSALRENPFVAFEHQSGLKEVESLDR